MTEAKISENRGTLELRDDGTVSFVGWSVVGGGDRFDLNIIDAVISLLREKREEVAAHPLECIEVPLR